MTFSSTIARKKNSIGGRINIMANPIQFPIPNPKPIHTNSEPGMRDDGYTGKDRF